MTRAKINKIILNRFKCFKRIELDLQRCTVINAKNVTAEIIENFISGFKFIFVNQEDIRIEDFQYSERGNNYERTYVEVHVSTSDETYVLQKSIENRQIVYSLNASQIEKDTFVEKIKSSGLDFPFSSLIDYRVIKKFAIMSEQDRATLIEELCSNSDICLEYDCLVSEVEGIQLEMKHLNDQKKELIAEQKAEKTKIDNSRKIKDINDELNETSETYFLFSLYHDQNAINDKPGILSQLKNKELQEVENIYKKNLEDLNETIKNEDTLEQTLRESNNAVNKKFKEVNQLKSKFDDLQLQRNLIENQNNFLKEISSLNEKYQKDINDLDKELNDIKLTHEQVKKSENVYNELLHNFNLCHPKTAIYEIIKPLIMKETFLNNCLGNHQRLIEKHKLENEKFKIRKSAFKEEIIQLKHKSEILQNKSLMKYVEYERDKEKIKFYEESIFNQKLKNLNSIDVKEICEKLNQKYQHSIVGILSELFEVASSNGISCTKKQILQRLGNFSNAIVVRKKEIISECEDYIKAFKYQDFNVTLIPIIDSSEVSLSTEIRNKKLPNVKTVPIENFIKSSAEIKNVIMNIFGPTIVCDSFENAEQVFDAFERKINVTSFVNNISFETNGLFINYSEIHNEPDTNASRLQFCRNHLLKLIDEINFIEKEKVALKNKMVNNKFVIALIDKLLEHDYKVIKFHEDKIKSSEKLLKEIQSIDDYSSIIKIKYQKLSEELKPLKERFFNDFCEKFHYNSIDEYENDVLKVVPAAEFQSKLNFLNENLKNYKQLMTQLPHLMSVEDQINKIDEEERDVKQELDKSQEEYKKIEEENIRLMQSFQETINNLSLARYNWTESQKKLESIAEKITDESTDQHRLNKQCYINVYNMMLEFINLPIDIENLFVAPPNLSEIAPDFDLMISFLKDIKMNFEKLPGDLKTNTNIAQKSRELLSKISSLKDTIRDINVSTGDKEILKFVNKQLLDNTKDIRDCNYKFVEVKEKIKNIRRKRAEKFNECLKELNKVILKFTKAGIQCVEGQLKAIDQNEPFENGVQYIWRDFVNPENFIDSSNPNDDAAFALILGVLNYKKQKLGIFLEVINKVSEVDLLKFFESEDADLQSIVICTTNVNEDDCHYSFLKRRDCILLISNE